MADKVSASNWTSPCVAVVMVWEKHVEPRDRS